MARNRTKAYPPEFRQKVVELTRAGRLPDDLAREFGLARQTVRNCMKQYDLDSGDRSDGLTHGAIPIAQAGKAADDRA